MLMHNYATVKTGNNWMSTVQGYFVLSGTVLAGQTQPSPMLLTGSAATQSNRLTVLMECTGSITPVFSSSGGVVQYFNSPQSYNPNDRIPLQLGFMRTAYSTAAGTPGQFQIFLDKSYGKLVSLQIQMEGAASGSQSDTTLSNWRWVPDPTGHAFLFSANGTMSGTLPNGNVGGPNNNVAYSCIGVTCQSGSVATGQTTWTNTDPTGQHPRVYFHAVLSDDRGNGSW